MLPNHACTLSTAVAPIPTDEGLKRKLVPRQIAMMAIGSAIGVGLFLGSTVTIRLAGPGGDRDLLSSAP